MVVWLRLRFWLQGMVWLIACFCRAILFLVKAKTLAIKMVVWLGLWFWVHGLVWLMVFLLLSIRLHLKTWA